MIDDLARTAEKLKLNPQQHSAFDAAAETIRARQAARAKVPQAEGPRVFGGGPGGGPRTVTIGPGDGSAAAQMRQRMMERLQQDFAAFRNSLDDDQRKSWDAAVAALVGARRAPLYKLVDGKPQPVMVRIGASDGTDTEISGAVEAGDLIVTGERAARQSAPPATGGGG
jgi:HlyD family secretion protein